MAAAAHAARGEAESTPEPTVVDAEHQAIPGDAYAQGSVPESHNLRYQESRSGYSIPLPPPPLADRLEPEAPPTLETPQPTLSQAEERSSVAEVRAEIGTRMREIGSAIGPRIATATTGAKGAFTGFVGSMRRKNAERRAHREERDRLKSPKRITAPPPSGALRSDGRRLEWPLRWRWYRNLAR